MCQRELLQIKSVWFEGKTGCGIGYIRLVCVRGFAVVKQKVYVEPRPLGAAIRSVRACAWRPCGSLTSIPAAVMTILI